MIRHIRYALVWLGLAAVASTASAQGFVLTGVGPVNRSMAGAGTAAPLDAAGSLIWNPAAISGLSQSRVDIGVESVYNRNTVNSVFLEGTPGELRGSSRSDAGIWALPSIGLVYKTESPLTYGLGIAAIGGFSTNYPGSATNPIFTPQPPAGVGFGQSYSRLGILQIAPTVSYQLSETLSVGVAPTIDIADLQANPFPFDSINANGQYPPGTGSRNFWGGGVQGGVFYQSPAGFNLGASLKSPQWFERAEINTQDAAGFGRVVTTQFEYPLIASFGAAYTAIEDVIIAADVRYVDFANTELFGEPTTFTPPPNFALRGLGWESVWIFALGTQLQLTDSLSFRMGYSYNQSPIPNRTAMFNVFAPAPFEHIFTTGFSAQLTRSIVAHATWVHAFDNSVEGPYLTPGGGVPLSRVSMSQEVDALSLGISVLF